MRLSPEAQRVLGSLVEKAMATPQSYPLSLNRLEAATNQKTNREPVVDYDEEDLRAGIDDLKSQQLVRAEYARGSRTPKYAHRLGEQLDLDEAEQAVLGVLLLRGPQTPGELRQHTDRLHTFGDLEAVDETLEGLADHRFGAFVERLPREAGQKEFRYCHLLGAEEPRSQPEGEQEDVEAADDLRAEVATLREEVDELRTVVRELVRDLD